MIDIRRIGKPRLASAASEETAASSISAAPIPTSNVRHCLSIKTHASQLVKRAG
jgi:hypothetical protein